jgi:cysteine desulfurase/selenocysteine lyase
LTSNPYRSHFPIFRHHPNLAYLDNAASTQKPQLVLDAIQNFYLTQNANIHRGVYDLSMQATVAYDGGRKKVQRFLNAAKSQEIIFTSGTTQGINLVANSFLADRLQTGDEVLVSAMEHHANLIPWQEVCRQRGAKLRIIPLNEKGELDGKAFLDMLGPGVRMLAIVHISNSLGTLNPVADMVQEAHRFDIPVLIDAAQSVSSLPIDVQELDCEFLLFSGHKLFGPTGIGALYGKEALLQQMNPYQFGGDMIRRVSYEEATYAPPPARFEAGTPNIAGAVGLGAAIDFVQSLDRKAVKNHLDDLRDYGTEQLNQIRGLKLIGQASAKSSILSFVMENAHPHDIATILNEEGIAIRAGHHCTQPLMHLLGIGGTARASFALYNSHDEIDRLVEALKTVNQIFA